MSLSDKDIDYFRKNFLNFRTGVLNFEGVLLPAVFRRIQNELENFEVDNDDIWVYTYPKSGTTWAQEMVWLISHNVDFEGAKQMLRYRSPFLEAHGIIDFENRDFQLLKAEDNDIVIAKKLDKPRNIKTHMQWHLLPKQIRGGAKRPRIIYVARNPKDVCVSFYYHCKLVQHFSGTFDEFYELFLKETVPFGSYWNHVLPMWEKRNEPNILFLRYEDMKRDLPSVIRKVAEFLNVNLTEKQVEKLDKHLAFDSMKKNPAVNYDFNDEVNPDLKFMRKGIVGDHKNKMSPEMIKRFDQWIQEKTEGTGLNFDA